MADEQPGKFNLHDVRLSFPHLFEPKAMKGGEPKFQASFLIEKSDEEQLARLKAAIVAAAKAQWPETWKDLKMKGKLTFCLHEGEEKDWDGYTKDNMYISTSCKKRPLVLDRDRSPLTKDDTRPYGGCYVDAIIKLWAQDNEFGKRVNAELMGVQFYRDGEPFGAGPVSPDEFKDYSEGEEKPKGKDKPEPEGGAPESGPEW